MTRPRQFCYCLLLFGLLSTSTAKGQLTLSVREQLARGVVSAIENLDRSQFPDGDLATRELLLRIDALEQFLTAVTDAANREAWLRYVDLDPLVRAIDSKASVSEQGREAMAVHGRLIGTTPGLEMSAMRQLRDAVEGFVDSLVFQDPDRSLELVEGQLRATAELLNEADDALTPGQFAELSARVSHLESSGQARELVNQIRATFSQPNAAIMIGSGLVQQAIGRSVEREREVRDCILGTRLVGNALLKGNVSAKLLPTKGSARILLTLAGEVDSNNDGYNGPIKLKTVGMGRVAATRTMTVDPSGIEFDQGSTQATLSTRITCIQHKLAIVRSIARNQAAKSKPIADRIALEKLRTQVGKQFATETSLVTPVTVSELLARAEPMLNRLALTKPTQSWSSDEDAISIESVFRGPEQLSSVVPRPPVSQPFAVALQLHESAIENAFNVMLAGRTLNEQRLNELLESVEKRTPAEDEDSEEPFEISFSRSRPVIFEARDQELRIGLRGTKFVQGDDELSKPMEITASYQPTVIDDRTVLQRVGEVQVEFSGRRLAVREVVLKRIIQRKFSKFFPERVLHQPLRISDTAKIQTLRGREFRPSQLAASDGWLTVAFE